MMRKTMTKIRTLAEMDVRGNWDGEPTENSPGMAGWPENTVFVTPATELENGYGERITIPGWDVSSEWDAEAEIKPEHFEDLESAQAEADDRAVERKKTVLMELLADLREQIAE